MAEPVKEDSEAWRNFMETTTAHGVRDWYHSESRLERTLWLLLLVFMCGALVFTVGRTVQDFHNNPVITSIQVQREIPKSFPDVYLCLNQGIDREAYAAANESTRMTVDSLLQGNWQLTEFFSTNFSSRWGGVDPRQDAQRQLAGSNLIELTDQIFSIAVKPESTLIQCLFTNNRSFNCSVAKLVINRAGICYKIPSPGSQTEHESGMTILGTMPEIEEEDEYDASEGLPFQFTDGANIGVTQAGEEIIEMPDSWLIKSGTFAQLKLEQTNRDHLGKVGFKTGSTRCRDQKTGAGHFRVLSGQQVYSRDMCIWDCKFEFYARGCGCVYSVSPDLLKPALRTSAAVCMPWMMSKCFSNMSIETHKALSQSFDQCIAFCEPACVVVSYQGSLTSKGFRSPANPISLVPQGYFNYTYAGNQHETQLGKETADHNVTDTANNSTGNQTNTEPSQGREKRKKFPKNTFMISILFRTLEIQCISESSSITYTSFISNIGGHFGLWIGASLMTFAQIFVFCFGGVFQKGKDRWQSKPKPVPKPDNRKHTTPKKDSKLYSIS